MPSWMTATGCGYYAGGVFGARQAQKRLDADGVADLVAAYVAGGRVKKLATQLGIHRDTVHNILERSVVVQHLVESGSLAHLVIALSEVGRVVGGVGTEAGRGVRDLRSSRGDARRPHRAAGCARRPERVPPIPRE